MAVKYIDRAGWEFTLSQACSPVGNGQCDGYDDDENNARACRCHGVDLDAHHIRTVQQVARLHHLGWLYEGHTSLTGTRVTWTNIED